MLHTTQQIAEKYGVTAYMITHTWIPNGLKHIPGARKGFLYKIEWVEEYLEKQAEIYTAKKYSNKQNMQKTKITKTFNKNNFKCFVS